MRKISLPQLLAVGLALLSWMGTAAAQAQGDARPGFVAVEGSRFVIDGRPYRFAGANFWYGAYLGAPGAAGDRERLRAELDQLQASGITNLRVLAVSEASGFLRGVRPATLTAPGEFDESLLQGLDFLLAEMAARDMKAVLYLNNFWQWSGGMSQYVSWFTGEPVSDPDATGDWNGFMQNSARFYRIPEAQAQYREVIETIVTRRNGITGVRYNEDPTVMSWQLANEPRPGSEAGGFAHFQAFRDWIHETAGFIRALAPRQLVSTGNEGAMGTLGDEDLYIIAHAGPNVDYLTFHLWPANWSWFDPRDAEATWPSALETSLAYIDRHIDIAGKLGKPVVLSEFGLNRDGGGFDPETTTRYRDRFYEAVFARLHQRAAAGDAIAGSNFWAWGGRGRTTNADHMWRPGDPFTGDPPQEPQGLYSVFDDDASTLRIISDHAAKMDAIAD